jgi:hypothetical protein
MDNSCTSSDPGESSPGEPKSDVIPHTSGPTESAQLEVAEMTTETHHERTTVVGGNRSIDSTTVSIKTVA